MKFCAMFVIVQCIIIQVFMHCCVLVHCYLAHASEPGCVIGFDVHVCIHITRKMVPITGRASASFSSMLKLKRIGNE